MASGSKRPAKRPTPPGPKKAPPKRPVTRRAGPLGLAMSWWIVIGVVAVALVVGIVVQTSRSETENAKVVVPKHQLGPNDSEIEGAASAPVLIQEYADFQCPSCKRFHDIFGSTIDDLVQQKKIRFAYTYFPFIGDESVRAAAAAVCAGDEDRFFQYQDILYTEQRAENSGFFTTDRLVGFGRDAGITGKAFDRFEQCVRSNRYEGFVRQQAENASKRGVNSTPTLFITGPNGNTTQMSGDQLSNLAAFRQAVDDAANA
jgi:protein-disulfide isomerase